MSEELTGMRLQYIKEQHPTCKTCLYHINASEIGDVTCQRWEIETHGGTFYCKDHEAKEQE